MICEDALATRPLLYSDTLGGKEVHRDDMWVVTTAELNEVAILRQRLQAAESALREIKNGALCRVDGACAHEGTDILAIAGICNKALAAMPEAGK